MPFDGSGNYVPPGAPTFPAVGGTTIVSTYYNAVINDLATALSLCITRDGQGKPTSDTNWNGKSLTNVNILSCTTLNVTNGIGYASGGTGVTTAPTNGQVLIGNGAGYVLANITGSSGVSVTNGAGTIALALSGNATASGLQVSASPRILGRSSAGAGGIEEISIGTGLSLAAGVLSYTGGGGAGNANLTFKNDGSGAAANSTYNGGGAVAISYNSIGAQPIAPNQQLVVSAATVTPTTANDIVTITAQAVNLTLANPTGAANDGQGMVIRIRDNGTARTITFGTAYQQLAFALPTTTVSNKWLYLGIIWNNTTSKWDVVSVVQGA